MSGNACRLGPFLPCGAGAKNDVLGYCRLIAEHVANADPFGTAAGSRRSISVASVKRPLSPIEKNLLPITSTEAYDFNCTIIVPIHVQDLGAPARLVPHVQVGSETQGADREPDGAKIHVSELVPGNRAVLDCDRESRGLEQRNLHAAFSIVRPPLSPPH